ncbi:BTAD domain-containing putative transcriptional regulator [Lentzea sp. NPDC058436]|uniref:AfsR/SARP family transcriptional regulator n=1 Tax=Lentzea sp. NPDC058436 TaxID=3346499 RepID=UPI003651D878
MGVELGLLGEVTARVDGREVELGPAKLRCVLAALAVDVSRLVPADRLVERVWGADAPRRGRRTLYSHISRLRQALSGINAVTVVSRAGGYALEVDRPEEVVDLHRFRALRDRASGSTRAEEPLTAALALWRGPALTGLDGEWAEAERDRLERERLAVRHDLTDTRLRLGQGPGLLAELASLADDHPLDERIAGQFLLALHQAGRTADALERYRRLRELLVEDLGTDPGAALQDLHRRILAADPALSVTTTTTPVVPLQLPAAPAMFTGRETALTELDRALVADPSPTAGSCATAVISTVGGTGGIGKTWLALTWAHRNRQRFPDGQLWADLRGFGPGEPKQAADVLADFLAALGVDRDHQPQDADARAALYRTHTAGRRMLVLLDNAATAEQVVPLLPGGDACTVLVTSRHRLPALLTRHGAHPVHLDVLTGAEARSLLHAALGDTRALGAEHAVAELIELCGGFPLALGLIAARVRADRGLLGDVVEDLRALGLGALDSDSPDASLPTVLSYSLRRLTEEQRTVFGLLGIAPGPDIALPAAVALTGLPEAGAHRTLAALEEASLIVRRPHGRYAMHDLVRSYAADTARTMPDEVRGTALRRVVDFYLHTSCAGERVLDPHRPAIALDPSTTRPQVLAGTQEAFDWFDTEHLNLLAAQRTAGAHGWHAAAWQLGWALFTFHDRRGHVHDQLAVALHAVAAGGHLDEPDVHVLTHRLAGMAYAGLSRFPEAVEHLNRSLALAEHQGDLLSRGRNHRALAWTWRNAGNNHQALHHAVLALEAHRLLGNPVEEALSRCLTACYAAYTGHYERAAEDCEIGLRQCRRYGIPQGEAAILSTMGYIGHHTGHHHRAIRDYEAAMALHRSLGDMCHVADVLTQIGHPHAALGRHDQARASWQEALEMYVDQGRGEDAGHVRRQLEESGRPSK